MLGSWGEDEAQGSSVYVLMGLGQVQGDHSRVIDLHHEESQHLMSDQGETFYGWLKDGAGDVSILGGGNKGVDLKGLERAPSWAQDGHPVTSQGGHSHWNSGAEYGQVRLTQSRGHVTCWLQQGQASPMTHTPNHSSAGVKQGTPPGHHKGQAENSNGPP